MFNAVEYACNLCSGSGVMMAADTQAEQLCGPFAFRCWCRYGDAKPKSTMPRWQRSLEKRFKPLLGVLIEAPKDEVKEPEKKVAPPLPAEFEPLW